MKFDIEPPTRIRLAFTVLELLAVAFICGIGFKFGEIMLIKVLQ